MRAQPLSSLQLSLVPPPPAGTQSGGESIENMYTASGRRPQQQQGFGRNMGATFYPGRDDYMMPELSIVSPSPQRIMPEVPVQIADSLEHLELEATSVQPGSRNGPNMRHPNDHQQPKRSFTDSYATPPSSQGAVSRPLSEERPPRSSYGGQYDNRSSYHSSIGDDYRYSTLDEPSYSPFPKLINPGPNIPPTDEEKEQQIEGARLTVLSSNDPEMQLIWAQDALNYVEVSMNHMTRISDPPGRPQTPALEHQLKTDAISVVSFLADQHHPRADFMRGSWLEFGKFGFRVDKKEAFRSYARAADKGYARAEYRMGMQYENSNEPMKAIKHYTQGAALGDSASNYRLGMMTLLGQHGQKQDYARGVHLIRLAAQAADENAPQGAYVFGMLLARELPGIEIPDLFLPLDIKHAKEMIEKAAFLGFARAQLKMGTAYELCQLGCDFNPALSLHYNALAARQGEAEADMAISKWFLCGHEGVFEKNEELAFQYAHRAAVSGLGTAEFALGYFYEIGMYVQVDIKEAQRWYGKAAAHGNKDASGRIDGISRSKTLSRKDHDSIAISKIKARHASQKRAMNPISERHQSIVSPIEEALDMPDPIIPPGGNFNYPPGSSHSGPPPRQRQGSLRLNNTNFNGGDGQAYLQPFGPQSTIQPLRPGTTAPYPVRPSSSGSLAPGARGAGPMVPAGTYPTGPPRSFTGLGPQGRPLSGQPGRQAYQGAQGYTPNSPPPDGIAQFSGFDFESGVPTLQNPRPPQGNKPPPIDIGFEAPLPRPSSSSKTSAPGGSSVSSQGSGRPGYGVPPGTPGKKPQGLNLTPNLGPGSPPSGPQYGPPAGVPPKSPPTNPAQAPQPATPAPAPKQSSSSKGGNGPKTFEEMGVPQQQKEQDCVIM